MSGDLFSLHLPDYFQTYENEIFRLVEDQYFIATRKLVDSDEEQRILEDILDASKPPVPQSNARGPLHYLLFTPFRYPPLKAGGRFHTRAEQSLFYAAQDIETAMAEVAYHRFLFLQHTQAGFQPMQVPYTHFAVDVASGRALRLTDAPFSMHRADISHPSNYTFSQRLGSAMRAAGVEVFTYVSARCRDGVNVGLFSPDAFARNKPVPGKEGRWSLYVSAGSVEFKRAHLSDNRKETHVFRIEDFYVSGLFPLVF